MLPGIILLHVADPAASAEFYGRLLDREPVENHPTFVSFALQPGQILGLWSKTNVLPAPAPSGGFEIGFAVPARDDVDDTCRQWRELGIAIVQQPVDLDFGRTFVGLDPDGHRLRIFHPSDPA